MEFHLTDNGEVTAFSAFYARNLTRGIAFVANEEFPLAVRRQNCQTTQPGAGSLPIDSTFNRCFETTGCFLVGVQASMTRWVLA